MFLVLFLVLLLAHSRPQDLSGCKRIENDFQELLQPGKMEFTAVT